MCPNDNLQLVSDGLDFDYIEIQCGKTKILGKGRIFHASPLRLFIKFNNVGGNYKEKKLLLITVQSFYFWEFGN